MVKGAAVNLRVVPTGATAALELGRGELRTFALTPTRARGAAPAAATHQPPAYSLAYLSKVKIKNGYTVNSYRLL